MPWSYSGLDQHFERDLADIKPQSAIDVGTGYGCRADLIHRAQPDCKITGHEIWPAYLKPEVMAKYVAVVEGDFREWARRNVDWRTDLIVFGDVLEHFFHSEAIDIIETCLYRSSWVAVFAPLRYLQNTWEGNPHEAHRCLISVRELANYNLVHYVLDVKESYFYALIRGLA